MPRLRRRPNSNLFQIDYDSIEQTLQEANDVLLEQSEEVLQKAAEISDVISTEVEQKLAESVLKRLNKIKKDVAGSRLSDGRPFSEAVTIIKNWFGKTEDRLKTSEQIIRSKLSSYLADQWKAHEAAANTTNKSPKEEVIIGTDFSGHSIVKSQIETNVSNHELKSAPPAPSTPVKWEVDGYDIERLALEDLRSYFSNAAVTNALKKHLKETRQPNMIQGAFYKQVADL